MARIIITSHEDHSIYAHLPQRTAVLMSQLRPVLQHMALPMHALGPATLGLIQLRSLQTH